MSVAFTVSQRGGRDDATPLAWNADPVRLLWSDFRLLCKNLHRVPTIVWPMAAHHRLDELYPWTFMNVWTLALHVFLVVYQLAFIISIPIIVVIHGPAIWLFAYWVTAMTFNKGICWLLNGPSYLDSDPCIQYAEGHDNERWIFLNGVSVGKHWLQANIDRLALTFRRPVRKYCTTLDLYFNAHRCPMQEVSIIRPLGLSWISYNALSSETSATQQRTSEKRTSRSRRRCATLNTTR